VTILYEDEAGDGALRDFGPHELLLALIADETGRRIDDLKREVDAHPAKGASKLLVKCAEEVGDNISSDCHPVVAIFDVDRVRGLRHRHHLRDGIPKRSTDAGIAAILEALCPKRDKLRVVLLNRNVESILRAISEVWPDDRSTHEPQYERAIRHKSRNDRDLILHRFAEAPGARELRRTVMGRVSGLAALRDAVIAGLKSQALRARRSSRAAR
jgi:hypothetical protein